VGAVGGRAGVSQTDLAARGQGAVGLAGFVGEQAAAFGGLEQALVDLVVVEGAGGDQVVEVAGGFPQLLVALPVGGGGDPSQLLGEGRLPIARSWPVAHRDGGDWGGSVGPAMLQPLQQRRRDLGEWGVQAAAGDPLVRVASRVAAGWGEYIAAAAPPVHLLQVAGTDVAQPGRSQVIVPAATAGPDQRPRAVEGMLAGEGADGLGAGGAVDVQDVELVAAGQADVGLGLLGPPGQHPGPIGGGVLEPVGHQAAEGVLADLAAVRIPTRAARAHRGMRLLSVVGDGLDAAVVGEWVVQGQHRDAPGGIAERGIAQLPGWPAHGVCSAAGGRWRCRKLAALLRPQPAAWARVRAVQGRPSGRGWA
jgi:hypothetical protein